MKYASSLYEVALEKRKEKLEQMFDGLWEKLERKTEEYSEKGQFQYDLVLDKIEIGFLDDVMRRCYDICKQLEAHNLTVLCVDYGNSYWLNLTVHVRWDGELPVKRRGFGYENATVHYSTTLIGGGLRRKKQILKI